MYTLPNSNFSCKDEHKIKIKKTIYNDNNSIAYSIANCKNPWGELQVFADAGYLCIIHLNNNEFCVGFSFNTNSIYEDVDYGYDGEDEYPICTTEVLTTTHYIPMFYCPWCGKKFQFEVVEEENISNKEEEYETQLSLLGRKNTKKNREESYKISQKLYDLRTKLPEDKVVENTFSFEYGTLYTYSNNE